MFSIKDSILVVVDVQGKLARIMHENEKLFMALEQIIRGAQMLSVPILWIEQNPERMGKTVEEIALLMPGEKPVSKMTFSCFGCDDFIMSLDSSGRKNVILTGIETHVCVYQTAIDLLEAGYNVDVLADAVSSRTKENKDIGLEKMRWAGADISSVETILFELMKTCEHEKFRDVLGVIK